MAVRDSAARVGRARLSRSLALPRRGFAHTDIDAAEPARKLDLAARAPRDAVKLAPAPRLRLFDEDSRPNVQREHRQVIQRITHATQ
jgi:hypothetical protein